MKVCVYAIACNEEENIDTWLKSMSEADEIYVMVDGRSTDNTFNILKSRGVHVKKKTIKPWRFDVARNENLKMVPQDADICVCTDLDEVFTPGWRKILESKWQKNTNYAFYDYWHNAGSPNEPPNIMRYSKIHDRNSFVWNWPIHEYIVQKDPNKVLNSITLEGVMLKHYPKNKARPYTEMLQDAVNQTPNDIRLLSLLAEGYLNEGKLDKVEPLLLRLKNNNDLQNQPFFYCFTYKMFIQLAKKNKDFLKAQNYAYECMSKIDNCKTIICELAGALIDQNKDFELALALFKKALTINNYIIAEREVEWKDDSLIYNYISICYWYLKDYKSALNNVNKAISLTKNENNLNTYISNKKLYEDTIKNNRKKTKAKTNENNK